MNSLLYRLRCSYNKIDLINITEITLSKVCAFKLAINKLLIKKKKLLKDKCFFHIITYRKYLNINVKVYFLGVGFLI